MLGIQINRKNMVSLVSYFSYILKLRIFVKINRENVELAQFYTIIYHLSHLSKLANGFSVLNE